MAFLDKINQVAKNIGDKTGDAIETTKLNNKIRNERMAAGDDFKKIGEYYYSVFAAGAPVAPEVLEFCQSAKAHFDAAAEAQAEVERIKTEGEPQQAPAPASVPAAVVCPSCGTANNPGTNFCNNCGAKLGAAAPAERKCPACGASVEPGVNFCSDCGQRVDG